MNLNGLIAAIVVVFFIGLFFAVKIPGPSIEGFIPIPRSAPKIIGWAAPTTATSVVNVYAKDTGAELAHLRRDPDGVLRQDPDDIERSTLRFEETPVVAFGRRLDQVGTFAGYFNRRDRDTDRLQIGVHYEPCSIFFGLVAPSLAVSKDLAGVGLVGRLPPTYFTKLSSLGVGVWECAPFSGAPPSWMVGAEFHVALP